MGLFKLLKILFEFEIYFICLQSVFIQANSNCNLVSSQRYYISSKDFRLTRSDSKYIMCAAYFCSHSPTVLPLQLTVHSINYQSDNIVVYLEDKSISFRNKCGQCEVPTSSSKKCKSCPKIAPSKGLEVHVRLPNEGKPESEVCSWDLNFNMSLQEFSCDEEKLISNIAIDNVCDVTFDTATKIECIQPTCSNKTITINSTQNFFHKLVPGVKNEICLWKLNTVPHKQVEINFSQNLKKYLTIYEKDLLTPKWLVNFCENVNNSIKIKPNSHTVFILYNNTETLDSEDSYFEIKLEEENLCDNPTALQNGYVDIRDSNKGKMAIFVCNQGYQLFGPREVVCEGHSEFHSSCVIIDSEKLMSDDPKFSNASSNNLPPSVIKPSLDNPGSRKPGKNTNVQESSSQETLASDEPEVSGSNSSIIEFDKNNTDEATKSMHTVVLPTTTIEGSGQPYPEYEDTIEDQLGDTEKDSDDFYSNDTTLIVQYNETHSRNGSFKNPWQNKDLEEIFSISAIEKNLMVFISVGVAVLAIVIITVISLIVRKNRREANLSRKFDTFQNPIYEKPVMPIPSNESDPSQEKIDLGDLSDSTVLD